MEAFLLMQRRRLMLPIHHVAAVKAPALGAEYVEHARQASTQRLAEGDPYVVSAERGIGCGRHCHDGEGLRPRRDGQQQSQ